MNKLEISSHGFRRARTRSLIQLGALMEKAGLLETFDITLGLDLQRDPHVKEQMGALFKGFLVLNELARSDDVYLPLWSQQGLATMAEMSQKKSQTK